MSAGKNWGTTHNTTIHRTPLSTILHLYLLLHAAVVTLDFTSPQQWQTDQPFHNKQLVCRVIKMSGPETSCTAEAVFLPHKRCSSWNSTSSKKGWGRYVQPSSPFQEIYWSIQVLIYSRTFAELLHWVRHCRNRQITKSRGGGWVSLLLGSQYVSAFYLFDFY